MKIFEKLIDLLPGNKQAQLREQRAKEFLSTLVGQKATLPETIQYKSEKARELVDTAMGSWTVAKRFKDDLRMAVLFARLFEGCMAAKHVVDSNDINAFFQFVTQEFEQKLDSERKDYIISNLAAIWVHGEMLAMTRQPHKMSAIMSVIMGDIVCQKGLKPLGVMIRVTKCD